MHTLDIAPLRSESPPQKRSGTSCSQGISQFYLHTHTFICNRNEPYLPLPSQPQLVLIYRPRRDGRLSRSWCEIAQAEIRARNLPMANPALYHTATSAPAPLCDSLYSVYDLFSFTFIERMFLCVPVCLLCIVCVCVCVCVFCYYQFLW